MISTGRQTQGSASNEGTGNNSIAGNNIICRSEGATLSGNSISVGRGNFKITCVSCDGVAVMDNCSGITILTSNQCFISNGVSGCSLMNCSGVTVQGNVSNFTGINLQNYVVTSADNNSLRVGSTSFFLSHGVAHTTINTPAPNLISLSYGTWFFNAASVATGGTLPSASSHSGKILYLKKIDTTANAVTISTTGGDLIDGGATAVLTMPYEAITVQSDGVSNWYII